MESYSWLRAKHTLATKAGDILVVCALVVLLSATVLLTGFVTPANGASPFAAEDSETTSFHAASVEQHATVEIRDSTDAYSAGETLEDASLYPVENASDPTLSASASVDHATLSNLTVMLTYRATRNGEGGEPFYIDEIVLAQTEASESGGSVNATVPIASVLNHSAALQEEFGNGVDVTVAIETTAVYEYETAGGAVVTQTLQTGGEIERVGNLYTFPTGSDRATHRPGASASPAASGSPFLNWLMLFAGLGAVVLGVVTGASKRYVDADEVAREIQWERFRDWVTEVESYTPQGDVNTVEVTNLNDLVNLAIDTNRRVLYHSPVEEYIVVEDTVMYKFKPRGSEETGSTELFGISKEDLDDTAFPNFDMFDAGEVEE